MHQLDLIRAATEDVESARVLLQERIEALDAIIQTALDHGIPTEKIAEASTPSPLGNPPETGDGHMLVA